MLQVDALRKRYGDIVALDGASFTVERGRMLGFLGPNGAGKTTSMRAILRLVDPDAGTVSWDGRPVDDPMRRRFGYMPEQRGLYPKMKIGDQVAWFGRLHGMTAPAAATATQAWLERLALSDRAGDPVETLSHGNQQRVQLATALVHDPELLILDEPFSGLDPIGAETMAGVLRERAAAGAAVLFSSHQLDVVEDLCDDVAIINAGRVVLEGDVRELKASSDRRVLQVEVGGNGSHLLEQLDGVLSSTFDGHRHRVVVTADTDVGHVLAAADRDAGVQHLSYSTPSLSELFREAIA
ncbi:ATP-binding cassette domain-containing protein [soil metagenome]